MPIFLGRDISIDEKNLFLKSKQFNLVRKTLQNLSGQTDIQTDPYYIILLRKGGFKNLLP